MPQLCCQTPLLPKAAFRLEYACCSALLSKGSWAHKGGKGLGTQQQTQEMLRVGVTRRCLLACARRSSKVRSMSSVIMQGNPAAEPTRLLDHL